MISDIQGPWDDVMITLPDTEMVRKAWKYAARAHASINQLRDYTNEPYIIHPVQVAAMVMTVEHDEAMICAALLHDVPEDLHVSPDVLLPEFGKEITEYVNWLTKPSRNMVAKNNYEERAKVDRDYLAQAPGKVQTIKVCDIILNCSSMIIHNPGYEKKYGYLKKYLNKNRKLIAAMTKADPILVSQANKIFEDFFNENQVMAMSP